jgi:hypothetical protein
MQFALRASHNSQYRVCNMPNQLIQDPKKLKTEANKQRTPSHALKRNLSIIAKDKFLSAWWYRGGMWWKKCLLCLLVGGLLSLFLLYEKLAGAFQLSHAYFTAGAWLFFAVMVWWSEGRRRVSGWIGWDVVTRRGAGWLVWAIVSGIVAGLLAMYVVWAYALTSEPNVANTGITPAVLAFSVPVVSAMLSGLAISAANYSRIASEHRTEMLRVAQKFVVATVLLIVFVVTFSFLLLVEKRFGQIDPNRLAWGQAEVSGGIFFWLSALSLCLGSFLFVLGVGELVSALVTLRGDGSRTGDPSVR